MMTFVAVMLFAVASQAMSLDWSATVVDAGFNPISGFTVTLVVDGTPQSSGVTDIGGAALGSLVFANSGFGSGLNIPTGTPMYFTLAGTTGGNNYSMTTSTFLMNAFSSASDNTALGILNTAWGASMDGGNGFLGLDNPSWTVTPVPEPTSMALLALGVAAFGLRRRFKV